MNASRFLVSAAAAGAVVGAIGMAYAQTSTTPAAPGSTGSMTTPEASTQTPLPPPTVNSDGRAASNDRTPGAAGTDASGLAAERAARVDRN
jgi:hypothetical protein